MPTIAARLGSLHPAARGAVIAGSVGGLVGLIVGLVVHPPTAWFAAFEIGLPSAAVGALLGLAFGRRPRP